MSSIFVSGLQEVIRVVRIGNEDFKLAVDLNALCYAEQVYATKFSRPVSAGVILGELLTGMLSALMATVYGAIRSGGREMPWEVFAKDVWGADQYDTLFEAASDAVAEMFGGATDNDSANGGAE